MDQIAHFQRRLAETVTWCALRDWGTNPADGLRTIELRPPESIESDSMILDWRLSHQEKQHIVEQVATKRAQCLHKQGILPHQLAQPLSGGRLLAFATNQTLSDGAAAVSTDGFFDNDNFPPWDTWVAYMIDDLATHRYWRGYLLSWVPEPLVEVVTVGIEVNPEDCIAWATDLDTAFIRQLSQVGLVR